MNKRIAIALFALLPFTAHALTLEEAIKDAGDNSPDLAQLRLKVESAHWAQTRANAAFLPKLDLDARHLFGERFEELELEFNGSNVVMPAIQPYSSLGVTASFNVFDGFRDANEKSAALFSTAASEHELTFAEHETRARIRTLFYRALGSQTLLDVAAQNVETLQSHLADLQARVRSGVSTRYDLLRVEVQLEEAQTDKSGAESNLIVSRAKLFEAIGVADDGQPLRDDHPRDLNRVDPSKMNLEENARDDRLAMVAERDRTIEISKGARAHWYPSVSLFGNYEFYNNYNRSLTESDERFKSSYMTGISLKWNLFDGGAAYASQRMAAIAARAADVKLAKFDREAPVALEEAKRRFGYDVLAYKAKLSSIKKAEEAVRLAKGGLRAGTLKNTDVLDAVVDLNRAKAAAVKAQIDAIEALGQLETLVGREI